MTWLLKPAALLLLCALCLTGQMNTGEIAGRIQDALGGALPGATLVAELAQTRQRFNTTSNRAGEYLLSQLPIGTYSLTVSAPSFKQSVVPNVDVHIGDTLRHDFTVQIGDANETVLVEANTGEVQLASAEIKDHRVDLRPESSVLRDQNGEFECGRPAVFYNRECVDLRQRGHGRQQQPESRF